MKTCMLPLRPRRGEPNVDDDIKRIESFGKRNSASDGEREAAAYLANLASASASEVHIQKFAVHPKTYSGVMLFAATCAILSYASYFFSTLVSLLLLTAGILPCLITRVLLSRFFDVLFSSGESQNVYALKRCAGEVKRRIILVSRYGADGEHSVEARRKKFCALCRAIGAIGLVYLFAINVARWALVGGIGAGIAQGVTLAAGLAGIVFAPVWGMAYFFERSDDEGEQLCGALALVYALDSLKDVKFENTEVGVLLAGSGEVGARGEMAFADEFCDDGVESVAFIMNVPRKSGRFEVLCAGGKNGDDDMARLVLGAAKAAGLNANVRKSAFEHPESRVFSRAGIRSVQIEGIEDSRDLAGGDHDGIEAGYMFALEIVGKFCGEANFEFSSAEQSFESNDTNDSHNDEE